MIQWRAAEQIHSTAKSSECMQSASTHQRVTRSSLPCISPSRVKFPPGHERWHGITNVRLKHPSPHRPAPLHTCLCMQLPVDAVPLLSSISVSSLVLSAWRFRLALVALSHWSQAGASAATAACAPASSTARGAPPSLASMAMFEVVPKGGQRCESVQPPPLVADTTLVSLLTQLPCL